MAEGEEDRADWDTGDDFGAPKKDVRLASFLGFFKSVDDAESGSALRFRAAMALACKGVLRRGWGGRQVERRLK